MAESEQRTMTSLNDLAALVSSLKSGPLRELVSTLGGGAAAADCSYHCVCVNSMCGCNSSVSKTSIEDISFPDFLKMREVRMRDLKSRLEALEDHKG
jgi:hypothetical protein